MANDTLPKKEIERRAKDMARRVLNTPPKPRDARSRSARSSRRHAAPSEQEMLEWASRHLDTAEKRIKYRVLTLVLAYTYPALLGYAELGL